MAAPAGRPCVVVVGSANLDQLLTVHAVPAAGTTVAADAYREEPGGKGLNQALAAARAGAHVRFVGAVGDDAAGRAVREVLTTARVDVTRLRQVDRPTGRAVIMVEATRENRIVLVAGANASVVSLTAADRDTITDANALVLQLELPRRVVLDAARTASAAGVPVALTPAPSDDLVSGGLTDLLDHTSMLFLNEHELAALTGQRDIDRGLACLLERVPTVVVTSGARGSDYADRSGQRRHCPATDVVPVDTTGAGDTYAGVFLASRLGGAEVTTAMARASAAAAVVVTRHGTSGAIPAADELILAGAR